MRGTDSVGKSQGVHVLGDVVHVGDVRPLLRIRIDAHIYQLSQLQKETQAEVHK